MPQIELIDSNPDRREAWTRTLAVAGIATVPHERYPTGVPRDDTRLILVHTRDLPQGELGSFVSACLGRIAVVAFSGGGLSSREEAGQRFLRGDRGERWPLPEGLTWVRRPLQAADDNALVIALSRSACQAEQFVAALDEETWPEHLTALYLVVLAVEALADDRKFKLLGQNWTDLLNAARIEAVARGLGALPAGSLTAESAALWSAALRQCLARVAGTDE